MAADFPRTVAADPINALVVLPTYNERDNIPGLVRALVAIPHVRVLVVDDQSR